MASPRLLSGGNPQVAKPDGDAPAQAFIAAVPAPRRELVRRLDALITRTVPEVGKGVRWNSPMYGIAGPVWFASLHVFTHCVKLTFFKGISLVPPPSGGSAKVARWVNLEDDGDFDERQLVGWIRQAARIPGWGKF